MPPPLAAAAAPRPAHAATALAATATTQIDPKPGESVEAALATAIPGLPVVVRFPSGGSNSPKEGSAIKIGARVAATRDAGRVERARRRGKPSTILRGSATTGAPVLEVEDNAPMVEIDNLLIRAISLEARS